jgi:predicted nucleic acid-binding protein
MFVLDTNVVSELMRPKPSRQVARWVAAQPSAALFTTTITQAEILYGIALLSTGKRQRVLAAAAEQMFAEDFAARVMSFDSAAALEFAHIAASRRRAGRAISHADAQIAAIARSRGAVLATRNTQDFAGTPVELVDPWTQ